MINEHDEKILAYIGPTIIILFSVSMMLALAYKEIDKKWLNPEYYKTKTILYNLVNELDKNKKSQRYNNIDNIFGLYDSNVLDGYGNNIIVKYYGWNWEDNPKTKDIDETNLSNLHVKFISKGKDKILNTGDDIIREHNEILQTEILYGVTKNLAKGLASEISHDIKKEILDKKDSLLSKFKNDED